MNCKTCEREFHYCSSCGYDPYMYEGFCSEECFKNSKEAKDWIKKLNTFWSSLNDEQKSNLWCLWDNGILYEGLYEQYADEIIKAPED